MNLIVLGFIGYWQVIIIILVIVLLFGAKRIPQLMKGLGQGMTEFKNATKKLEEEKEIESKKDKSDD